MNEKRTDRCPRRVRTPEMAAKLGARYIRLRGEAPLGIVYQTDLAADKNVKFVGVFPDSTHPPIIYPIAVTAASNNPDVTNYMGFLKSPAAKQAFENQGFVVLR